MGPGGHKVVSQKMAGSEDLFHACSIPDNLLRTEKMW